MPEHSTLTGADLHEPKGQASASVNTVYVANGSGSGTHKKLTVDSLDLTDMQDPNTVYLTVNIPDISTASAVIVPAPATCTFESAVLVLGGTITVADASISFTRNDGSSHGTPVTVPYSGSGEGDVLTFTASINKDISSLGYIKVSTDGASTNTVPVFITLKFLRVI